MGVAPPSSLIFAAIRRRFICQLWRFEFRMLRDDRPEQLIEDVADQRSKAGEQQLRLLRVAASSLDDGLAFTQQFQSINYPVQASFGIFSVQVASSAESVVRHQGSKFVAAVGTASKCPHAILLVPADRPCPVAPACRLRDSLRRAVLSDSLTEALV